MIERPVPDKYGVVSSWPDLSEDAYSTSANEHKTHASTSGEELNDFKTHVSDHASKGEAACFEAHSSVYRKHSSTWDDHNDALGFIAHNHEQVSEEIIRVKKGLRDTCDDVTKKADELYKKADKADQDANQALEEDDTAKAAELKEEASKLRAQAVSTIAKGKEDASTQYVSGMEGIGSLEASLTSKLQKWGVL